MNRKFRQLFCFVALPFLCGCTSYRAKMVAHWETDRSLSPHPLNAIEGQYSNGPEYGSTLWNLLTYEPFEESDVIVLSIIPPRRLKIALERGGTQIESRIVKYSEHPYHIQLADQNHTEGPLFPFLWVWDTEELAFGITPEKDLSVYRVWNAIGFLGPLFFGAGGGPGIVYTYKRIDPRSPAKASLPQEGVKIPHSVPVSPSAKN